MISEEQKGKDAPTAKARGLFLKERENDKYREAGVLITLKRFELEGSLRDICECNTFLDWNLNSIIERHTQCKLLLEAKLTLTHPYCSPSLYLS